MRSEQLQEKGLRGKLKDSGFYEGEIDGDLGARTIRAVLAFQVSRFGDNAEDGAVGLQTGEALGLKLGKA